MKFGHKLIDQNDPKLSVVVASEQNLDSDIGSPSSVIANEKFSINLTKGDRFQSKRNSLPEIRDDNSNENRVDPGTKELEAVIKQEVREKRRVRVFESLKRASQDDKAVYFEKNIIRGTVRE